LDQNPNLPVTPGQIAQACLDAAAAGAAIVHIHVRHPDGRPSMELAHYQEVVELIRAKNDTLVLNLTTGPGGRYHPSDDNPAVAGPRTNFLPPLRRVEHVIALRPDIATLDLNTMTFGSETVINTPATRASWRRRSTRPAPSRRSNCSTAATSSLRATCLPTARCACPRCARSCSGSSMDFRPRQRRCCLRATVFRRMSSGPGSASAGSPIRCWRKPMFSADMCASGWRTRSMSTGGG
ncbi:MAG: 3-keto-5-aminohexanoate cleavage protein, partial [Acetobacteraceae bacterium]|nr:3-keto-5-aminohexanoate cleavage protein [Acetobacteraceae bacterium]